MAYSYNFINFDWTNFKESLSNHFQIAPKVTVFSLGVAFNLQSEGVS